jgi:hypothetical protein
MRLMMPMPETEKAGLELDASQHSPDVLELHPGVLRRYQALVKDLRVSLSARDDSKQGA